MAAPFTLGSPTTGEGQVLTAIRELIQAEDAWVAAGLALTPPVTRARRFTLTPNLTTGVIAISGNLPIEFTDSVDGLTISATEYIV